MKVTSMIFGAAAVVGLVALGAVDAEAGKLKGSVRVDGSSTVYPVTEAVAEEFRAVQPRVRVTVGFSGTGGGFKKFTIGETDMNDASRPIKAREIAKAEEKGVGFIELPIAYDGLSVVVNPANDFATTLTVEELNAIWKPGSTVKTWQDVRPGWPAEEIKLYGPGVDSGTFDYFTKAVNGKEQACRADYTASEDDNVLVQGVAGDKYAMGFFGYAYYEENKDKIRVCAIDGGNGPVLPTMETINNGTYAPLSRPIYVYVSSVAAEKPEVVEFVNFYLDNAASLSAEVGYVPLPDEVYELVKARFAKRVMGTVYGEDSDGKTLVELYALPTEAM